MKQGSAIAAFLLVGGGMIATIGFIAFCMSVFEATELAFAILLSSFTFGFTLMGIGQIIKLLQRLVETTKASAQNTKIAAEATASTRQAPHDELPAV